MSIRPADLVPDRDERKLAVLNLQRTCVHDGPGIRTTVFFRGCPLRCRWCQNPEAQAFVSPSALDAGQSVSDLLAVIARDRPYYLSTDGGVTLSGGEPLAQPRAALLAFLKALKRDGIPVAVETAGDVPWSTFQACRTTTRSSHIRPTASSSATTQPTI